jgi:Major Facilitator Superfamily
MFGGLPGAVRALLWVRILNQLGAYTLGFLAVLAGHRLAPLALTIFGVAALVSRWGGGLLLDRLAPRTVIVIGLLGTGLAMAALAAADSPALVLVATGLVGLAFEIYEPASQELLARLTSGPLRRQVYGYLGTSLAAAGAIGGLVAAVLLPSGVRWLLVADAATCLAAAVLAVTFLGRDRPLDRDSRRGAGPSGRGRWRPPAELVRLTGAGTGFAFGHLAVMMFIPLVLLQRGAPAWLPGLTLTGAALLTPITAHLTRERLGGWPNTVTLAVGAILLAVLAAAMAAGSLLLTVLGYAAWSAVGGILLGRWQATIAETAPEPDRPRWFAFHGASWGIAQPAVPLVAALGAGAVGGTGPAALFGGAAAFLTVPIILTLRWSR